MIFSRTVNEQLQDFPRTTYFLLFSISLARPFEDGKRINPSKSVRNKMHNNALRFTTNLQTVFDLLLDAGQDQHLYRPYLSDLAKNVPATFVRQRWKRLSELW
jgi:hypothetical protein